MLKKDVQALKQCLRKSRRNRQFDNQFASLLHLGAESENTVLNYFPKKFPKITNIKQSYPTDYSYCSVLNSFTNNNLTAVTKSEVCEDEELNKQDQEFWRKHYKNMSNLPAIEANEEICKIVKAFKSLGDETMKNTSKVEGRGQRRVVSVKAENIFDLIYESYRQSGGEKSLQELIQKIQSDVVFLVSRQMQKKQCK